MTFKQFEKHILRLKELTEERDRINDVLKKSKLSDDFNEGLFGITWYETLIINILKDIFNDEADWIGYWIYELDYGKSYKGCVKEKGKAIPLKTVKDLYNLITRK